MNKHSGVAVKSRLLARLIVAASLFASTTSVLAQQTPVLYSLSRDSATLYTLDPATGETLDSQAISLTSRTIRGGRGLAASPITQQLFAVLAYQEGGSSPRLLATIDPVSGSATEITDSRLGQTAALAFDNEGTLYGGQAANAGEGFANKLYVFDTETGERTEFMPFADSQAGLALALNPLDGQIYHLSGSLVFGTDSTTPVFEKINTATKTRTEIPVSGDDMGHVRAMTYGPDGNFLVVGTFDPFGSPETDGRFFRLTPDGVATELGSMGHFSKGIAFVPHITAPEIDTDDDGLLDAEEGQIGTDPARFDTDGDGLGDGDEVAIGTDPLDEDTDGDSLADGLEVEEGFDPLAETECPTWLCRRMSPAILQFIRDRQTN